MSDAMTPIAIELPKRKVVRDSTTRQYVVVEATRNNKTDAVDWVKISKYYPHSTSAYAKLGRITNDEVNKKQ